MKGFQIGISGVLLLFGAILVLWSVTSIIHGRSLLEASERATVVEVRSGARGRYYTVYEHRGQRGSCEAWTEVGDTVLFDPHNVRHCKLESAVPYGSGTDIMTVFAGLLLLLLGFGVIIFDRLFNTDRETISELAAIEAALREHDRRGG